MPGQSAYRRDGWNHYMVGRYVAAIPFVRRRRVLEIGAGYGWGAYLLAPKAARYTALDSAEAARDGSRALFGEAFEYRVATSRILVGEGFVAETVIAYELIEHLDVSEARALLADIRALMPGGGHLLLSSVFPPSAIEAAHLCAENEFHKRVYSRSELRALVAEAELGQVTFWSDLLAHVRVRPWT